MGRNSDERTPLQRLLGPLAGETFWSRLFTIGLILIGLVVGSILVWHKWGRDVVTQGNMMLDGSRIHLTAPPTWITRTDVKQEAITQHDLESLSYRQTDVTVQVAQAFTMHPWIAKVRRCSKTFPGELTVDVQYRQPVAMVVVTNADAQLFLLPVDGDGVLLPVVDFPEQQAHAYPRIFPEPQVLSETVMQTKKVGQPWGDPRVHAGSRVAQVLGPVWKSLDLFAIRCQQTKRSRATSGVQIELRTQNDTRIWWGSPPGAEAAGEPTADIKVARLREFQVENGALDKVGPQRMIDLTRGDRLYVARANDSSS